MPAGNPNTQTIASQKYQRKVGIIAKTYKIKKDLADDFLQACEIAGVSQSAQISKMMQEFISETMKDHTKTHKQM